ADADPHAEEGRRPVSADGDSGKRKVEHLAHADVAGFELDADEVGVVRRRGASGGLDTEILVHREGELLGQLFALVSREIEDHGDLFLAAPARDASRHAPEAVEVNDHVLAHLGQDGGDDAGVAWRDVRRAAVEFAPGVVEQTAVNGNWGPTEAAALAQADL